MKLKSKNIFEYSIFILLLCFVFTAKAQNIDNESQVSNTDIEEETSFNILQVVYGGVLLNQDKKNRTYFLPGIFEWFPANTVEGFAINPQVKITQKLDGGRFLSLFPSVRYGVGNGRFQAGLESQYYYNPERSAFLSVSGGRKLEQIFHESTMSSFNNIIYTYIYKDNYLKIYERSYVAVEHAFSPIQDFWLQTTASWNERNPMINLLRYEEDENYTSNDPANFELLNTAFEMHQAFIIDVKLRWQIGHHLVNKRGQLISKGSYPGITLSYSKAFSDVLGGDVSYQKMAVTVEDEYTAGQSKGRWLIEAGDFLSNDEITFVDFNHFKGKRTFYGTYDNDQFHLLDFYANSTADFYIQGHYEHQFKPLTKSQTMKFEPILGAHYLFTEAGGHYFELGGGFGKALGGWRIDFYSSWRDGDHERIGLRVGLIFD